tara:strand:- start:1275 stop:1478 length:204 start_codon:yes stop_codon:yes gene_type:complete
MTNESTASAPSRLASFSAEGLRKKCVDCKKEKPTVKDGACPYAADVHGDYSTVRLCKECYDLRADEI